MGSGLEECVRPGLRILLDRLQREYGSLRRAFSRGYSSYEWQHAKRLMADVLAQCLSRLDGVLEIYIDELHGGEPANLESMGGKDLDLIIVVDGAVPGDLEEELEKIVREELGRVLGCDPLRLLGIPNIVEVKIVDRCYLEHRYVKPIRIWPSSS